MYDAGPPAVGLLKLENWAGIWKFPKLLEYGGGGGGWNQLKGGGGG